MSRKTPYKQVEGKAAAILARGAYFQYVSTAKWRKRRWWSFSRFPLMNAFSINCFLRRSLIVFVALLGGCFGHAHTAPQLTLQEALRGMASWYGPSFHGKPSASGELYDMWALTAAHKTLPFGTWVQVKKEVTGETVTVRINDRGPFIKGRIIDLSYAAARELRMIGDGTAEVTLTLLTRSQASISSQAPAQHFWVQAGAYPSLTEAMTLRERLALHYAHVRVKTVSLPSGESHRVQIGSFHSKNMAQAVVRALKKSWGIVPTVIHVN